MQNKFKFIFWFNYLISFSSFVLFDEVDPFMIDPMIVGSKFDGNKGSISLITD